MVSGDGSLLSSPSAPTLRGVVHPANPWTSINAFLLMNHGFSRCAADNRKKEG